jgi:hypothetical protein
MTSPRTAPSTARRGAPVVAATAQLALIAAGCGGSPAPSTSDSGSAHANGPGAAAYRFTACVRSHGVPNFPDPIVHVSSSSANGSTVSVGIRITPGLKNSPGFKAAIAACNHILPGPDGQGPSPAQQQVRTRAMVAFAQCLRTHGFPHFPDPTARGELSLAMVNAAGINLHTPALLTAAKGCTSVTHGQITPAQVVRAINGPH